MNLEPTPPGKPEPEPQDGAIAEQQDGVTTQGDKPTREYKRRAYHPALVAAFLSGCSVSEAAEKAGVCARTAQRWLKEHRDDLAVAEKQLVDDALKKLRSGLVLAAGRLQSEVENKA